jgi:hypothetical protein
MFKVKNITPQYNDTYVGGGLYKVVYINKYETEYYICLMSSWTLGCCGARSLFQFDLSSTFWTDGRVDEFLTFLDESDTALYYSREVYFMFSDFQENHIYMQPLITHSGTKRVDQFTNRGTGGKANMSLYRWSSEMPDEEDEDEEDEE